VIGFETQSIGHLDLVFMRSAVRRLVAHPYRTSPPLNAQGTERVRDDDSILAVMLLVLGGFRVAVALSMGEIWRAEPTIALLMILCGLGLLLPRRKPLLDVFYVAVFLVLFMLAFALVGIFGRLS